MKISKETYQRLLKEDSVFYQETRKLAQIKWKEYYCKSDEEFIKEFKTNYKNNKVV